MVDLNSLIDPSLGITLQRAVGINDLGQIIAGGTNASGPIRRFPAYFAIFDAGRRSFCAGAFTLTSPVCAGR
jgi:hypothetical protein